MIEKHRGMGLPDRPLARFRFEPRPMRTWRSTSMPVSTASSEQEDRTGEDYYGRSDREQDDSFIALTDRQLLNVSHDGRMLVLEQQGLDENGASVVVHYYLSPYRPTRHSSRSSSRASTTLDSTKPIQGACRDGSSCMR